MQTDLYRLILYSPKARGGWYDIVVAMYHDQGHIPLKVVGFVYNHEKKAWMQWQV